MEKMSFVGGLSSDCDCETETNSNGVDAHSVVIILLTIGAVLILVFVLVIVLVAVMGFRIARLKAALHRAAATEPVTLSPVSPREATGPEAEGQVETREVLYDSVVVTTAAITDWNPTRGLASRNESPNPQDIELKENSAYVITKFNNYM